MGNGSIIIVIGAVIAAVLFLPKMLKGKATTTTTVTPDVQWGTATVASEAALTGGIPVTIAEPTLTHEEFQIELAALAQTGTPAEGYWISPHGE